MDLFIICFSLAALLYVLTLPFVGKRAHKEEEPKRGYSKHFSARRESNCVQSHARFTR